MSFSLNIPAQFHRNDWCHQPGPELSDGPASRVLRERPRQLNLELASEVIPRQLFLQYLDSTRTAPCFQRLQNLFSHVQAGVVLGEHEHVEFRPLPWGAASDWAARAPPHRETATRQRRIWAICPAGLPHPWSCTRHLISLVIFNCSGILENISVPIYS